MRNRWFAILRFLEPRHGRYRYVLMSDTRDALLQVECGVRCAQDPSHGIPFTDCVALLFLR